MDAPSVFLMTIALPLDAVGAASSLLFLLWNLDQPLGALDGE